MNTHLPNKSQVLEALQAAGAYLRRRGLERSRRGCECGCEKIQTAEAKHNACSGESFANKYINNANNNDNGNNSNNVGCNICFNAVNTGTLHFGKTTKATEITGLAAFATIADFIKFTLRFAVVFAVFLSCASCFISMSKVSYAAINSPVAIDSRIKTLVYSPNEVFQLKFIVGFQSMIEFETDEEVELVSFGDPLPWTIKVAKRIIFIKAVDPDVKTNMIITTNKRTYFFEISSSNNSDLYDDQVVFLVRFFYPEVNADVPQPFKIKDIPMDGPIPIGQDKSQFNSTVNFQYTFAGTGENVLPLRVFDNGKQTFLQFRNNNAIIPSMYSVDNRGYETRLKIRFIDDYIVIDSIEYQISLRYGKELVCLFNEALLHIAENGKILVS